MRRKLVVTRIYVRSGQNHHNNARRSDDNNFIQFKSNTHARIYNIPTCEWNNFFLDFVVTMICIPRYIKNTRFVHVLWCLLYYTQQGFTIYINQDINIHNMWYDDDGSIAAEKRLMFGYRWSVACFLPAPMEFNRYSIFFQNRVLIKYDSENIVFPR